MAVKIVLTEEMIRSFGQCDEKKEYRKVYIEHQDFFENLFEKLKLVNSPHDHDNKICSNAKFMLRYLWKWNRNSPFLHGKNPTDFENEFSKMFDFLKTDISTNKWNILYSEYVFVADSLIRRARKQGIFDFQIEYDKKFYETFKARDTAKREDLKKPEESTNPPYSDATDYDSSDSEDEDDSSDEESKKEIEDSDNDDLNSKDEEEEQEVSAELEEAVSKTGGPVDLITELAKISKVFPEGMAEFRAAMSDWKTDSLKKMKARGLVGMEGESLSVQEKEITVERLRLMDRELLGEMRCLDVMDRFLDSLVDQVEVLLKLNSVLYMQKNGENPKAKEFLKTECFNLIEETSSFPNNQKNEDLVENAKEINTKADADLPLKPMSTDNLVDKELQKMEQEFHKKLAEQAQRHEIELRRVQEERRET